MRLDIKELKGIEGMKERNFKERLLFIKFWVNYMKTHSDEEWSEQQNEVIDSQIQD